MSLSKIPDNAPQYITCRCLSASTLVAGVGITALVVGLLAIWGFEPLHKLQMSGGIATSASGGVILVTLAIVSYVHYRQLLNDTGEPQVNGSQSGTAAQRGISDSKKPANIKKQSSKTVPPDDLAGPRLSEKDEALLVEVKKDLIAGVQLEERVLQELNVKLVKRLARYLRCEHLPMLSYSVIQDSQFPWTAFMEKPGIGEALGKSENINSYCSIPWEKLPRQEATSLFRVGQESEENAKEVMKNLIGGLDIQAVQKLAPRLGCEHLPMLSYDVIQNSQFPWTTFMEKPGIGDALGKSENIHSYCSIPWEKLPREEATSLFRVGQESEENAKEVMKNLIRGLDIQAVQKLAPHLGCEHLPMLSYRVIQDSQFPWATFMEQPGFDDVLSKHGIVSGAYSSWKILLDQ